MRRESPRTSARKSPRKSTRKVSVLVRRGDVQFAADHVPASEAGALAGFLWCELRALVQRYPDIDPPDVQQIGGYTPTDVPHDGDDETPPETKGRKRVGFTLERIRQADGADLRDT